MGGACRMHGEAKYIQNFDQKGRDHSEEDLDMDGRIILEWILVK